MSLKDRLKNKTNTKKAKKTENKQTGELCEFKISIAKVSKAINKVSNVSDLGNIVQEFSKFLSTLPTKDASITFSGNFDLGQKMLLNCVLGNFLEGEESSVNEKNDDSTQKTEKKVPQKEPSKLIKKRKSIKSKLAEKLQEEDA